MARTKAALRKRLNSMSGSFGLELSKDLFGYVPDCDFELTHYVGFLDRVGSCNDLVRGLKELDPFVDDALAVAEAMTEEDFREFKTALIKERSLNQNQDNQSTMPTRYGVLLIPERFISAKMIADEFATTLEVALTRIMQNENGF